MSAVRLHQQPSLKFSPSAKIAIIMNAAAGDSKRNRHVLLQTSQGMYGETLLRACSLLVMFAYIQQVILQALLYCHHSGLT